MNNHILVVLIHFFTFVPFIFITNIDRSNELFIKLIAIPIIGYLLIIFILEMRIKSNSIDDKLFWGYSILIRLMLLLFPVALSDDAYRYAWDGILQHKGINPYLYSPNAAELAPYRTNWWYKINNPNIKSPYPPLAQFLFFIVTLFSRDIRVIIFLFRLISICFDLGIILILKKLFIYFNIPRNRLIYYAWSPLTLLEFAGNGHYDALAVFFVMLSVYFVVYSENNNWNGLFLSIAIALAILAKVFPIVLLGFLVIRWRIKELIGFLITIIVFVIPLTQMGINPLFPQGQQTYVKYFRFNESIFRIYRSWISNFTNNPDLVARKHYTLFMMIIVAIYVVKFLNALLRKQECYEENLKIISYYRYIVLIALLTGPDIQPWYILWILPIAVIFMDWVVISWSLSILFSYSIYPNYDNFGIWREDPLILFMEYSIVYLILIHQIMRNNYLRFNSY